MLMSLKASTVDACGIRGGKLSVALKDACRHIPAHTNAYQRKDGVDDIGIIYFIVYRI